VARSTLLRAAKSQGVTVVEVSCRTLAVQADVVAMPTQDERAVCPHADTLLGQLFLSLLQAGFEI
jgi:hypothetical protein